MNGRYAAPTADRHEFPELESKHGEDPARFLQANRDLAFARINGIRDHDLLDAYRTVEREITDDNSRAEIVAALAARERELTDADLDAPNATANGGVA